MGKKVLLIINPVSGTLGSRNAIYDILSVFCAKDWDVTIKLTQHRGHGRELAAAAKDAEYELVCCCGGDGTLNEVISGLASSGSDLPLGYIPAGSTNDFADSLKIPVSPKSAAENIAKGSPKGLDIGKFGEDRYFSYIASFGAFSSTSYSAQQDLKNAIGHLAYVVEGVKSLPNIKPIRVKISHDEKTVEDDYIFGAVCNTRSIGGIVKLAEEQVDFNDGLFEVIMVKNPVDLIDLNDVMSGALGSDFNNPMFEYFKTKEITIQTETGLQWSLDGERAESGSKIVIRNIKSGIDLIY